MVEKIATRSAEIVDLAFYRDARRIAGRPEPMRCCQHCGATLMEGESDDDCSSAATSTALPGSRELFRKFFAD